MASRPPRKPRRRTPYPELTRPAPDFPAAAVQGDFDKVYHSLDEIIAIARAAIRDDGKLKNGLVGVDQLKQSLLLGFSNPVTWSPGTAFIPADVVAEGNTFYLCLISHTSSDEFAMDLAAGRWEPMADYTGDPILSKSNLENVDPAQGQSDLGLGGAAKRDVGSGLTDLSTNEMNEATYVGRDGLWEGVDLDEAHRNLGLAPFARTGLVTDVAMPAQGLLGRVEEGEGPVARIRLGTEFSYEPDPLGRTALTLSKPTDAQVEDAADVGIPVSAAQIKTKLETVDDVVFGPQLYEDKRNQILRYDRACLIASHQGGYSLPGGAWRTRPISKYVNYGLTGFSVGADTLRLEAGTYYIKGYAFGFGPGSFKARLQKTLDLAESPNPGPLTLIDGTSERAGGGTEFYQRWSNGKPTYTRPGYDTYMTIKYRDLSGVNVENRAEIYNQPIRIGYETMSPIRVVNYGPGLYASFYFAFGYAAAQGYTVPAGVNREEFLFQTEVPSGVRSEIDGFFTLDTAAFVELQSYSTSTMQVPSLQGPENALALIYRLDAAFEAGTPSSSSFKEDVATVRGALVVAEGSTQYAATVRGSAVLAEGPRQHVATTRGLVVLRDVS